MSKVRKRPCLYYYRNSNKENTSTMTISDGSTNAETIEKARKLFALAAVIRFTYEAFVDSPQQDKKQQLLSIEAIPNISSDKDNDIQHQDDNKDTSHETVDSIEEIVFENLNDESDSVRALFANDPDCTSFKEHCIVDLDDYDSKNAENDPKLAKHIRRWERLLSIYAARRISTNVVCDYEKLNDDDDESCDPVQLHDLDRTDDHKITIMEVNVDTKRKDMDGSAHTKSTIELTEESRQNRGVPTVVYIMRGKLERHTKYYNDALERMLAKDDIPRPEIIIDAYSKYNLLRYSTIKSGSNNGPQQEQQQQSQQQVSPKTSGGKMKQFITKIFFFRRRRSTATRALLQV